MINRLQWLADIIEFGRKYKIEPKRLRTVHSFPNAKPKMIMISLRKDAKNEFKIMEPLYIYEKTGVYSKEIEEIYGKK